MRIEQLPFTVQPLERMIEYAKLPSAGWRHPHRQLLWFKKGTGKYSIDNKSYNICEGSIYFAPPGVVQRLTMATGLAGYLFSFSSDILLAGGETSHRVLFAEMVYNTTKVDVTTANCGSEVSILQQLAEAMLAECDDPRDLSNEVLCTLFNTFLTYLCRFSACTQKEETTAKAPVLFRLFFEKLEREFVTNRTVANYAADLSISAQRLTEVVRRVTGYPASTYIRQRTATEAKRLAIFTEYNMKFISYQLGFEDQSHFSKFFKRATGMCFSAYKKSLTRRIPTTPAN